MIKLKKAKVRFVNMLFHYRSIFSQKSADVVIQNLAVNFKKKEILNMTCVSHV